MSGPLDWVHNSRDGGYEEEKVVAKVNTATTYTFDEEAIRAILVEHMAATYAIDVEPKDFTLNISDSTTTGYMDNQFVPAKLKDVSITVKAD